VRVPVAAGVAALVLAVACSGGDDAGEAAGSGAGAGSADVASVDPYDGHTSEVYDGTARWICHPDLADDTCRDLSATEVRADGTRRPAELAPATDPAIDCFYVYPTVSADPGVNSDLSPGEAEISTVAAQAAPFASTCRVFAPAYRQLTLAALGSGGFGDAQARATAYGDVVDAWRTYVSQHNGGREVVLIGHSQGTSHLVQLLRDEIDPSPELRDRLVSAILLGGTVGVPDGEVVGGELSHIPACEQPDQVGCVITFSSYPADSPPGPGALFAGAPGEGRRALCVDPVALAGGNGLADPIIPASAVLVGSVDTAVTEGIDTRYVVLPDALTAGCQRSGDYDFFGVAPAAADDRRPLQGLVTETLGPAWGLHLYDVNLALGDLLEVVATQAEAFAP
jgi:hypothetical protein